MFDHLDQFRELFQQSPVDPVVLDRPFIRRRKPFRQRIAFWAANIVILPVVLLIYVALTSEGIRLTMRVFAMRLGQLPIPGMQMASRYDGFNKLDLAHLASILLFIVTTWVYIRLFDELQGHGSIDRSKPLLKMILSVMACLLIGIDAFLFFVGIRSKSGGGWTQTPTYVAPLATVLYSCGLALLGYWHSEHKNYGKT